MATTPNLGWTLPDVGQNIDTWGDILNDTTFVEIDSAVYGNLAGIQIINDTVNDPATGLSERILRAGDTMTGQLGVLDATSGAHAMNRQTSDARYTRHFMEAITGGENLNSIGVGRPETDEWFIKQISGIPDNIPPGVESNGSLLLAGSEDTDTNLQVFIERSNGASNNTLWIRGRDSGTWRAWMQFPNEDQVDQKISDAADNIPVQADHIRAWVVFNTAGNIRRQFNVDTVTKNGIGLYTVEFTNNIGNETYGMTATGVGAGDGTSGSTSMHVQFRMDEGTGEFATNAKTTGQVRLQCYSNKYNALTEAHEVTLMILDN